MDNIKLLEGLTVAAETLGGEVLFFSISGKILSTFGYGHSFTFCFISYAVRLGAISLIPSPWWILPIELIMQGPTYAMSYTTIVAYTSAISPPGTSATMQGIAAGMDDGFGNLKTDIQNYYHLNIFLFVGYAIGSMIGGVLYSQVGGKTALRIFCGIALTCGIIHFILCKTVLSKKDDITKAKYQSPTEAIQITDKAVEA